MVCFGVSWAPNLSVWGPLGGVLGSNGELFGALGAICCLQVGKQTLLMGTWRSMGSAQEPSGNRLGPKLVDLGVFGGVEKL